MFAREHLSHALIEIDVEDEDSGRIISEAFGVSQDCWGNKNANASEK